MASHYALHSTFAPEGLQFLYYSYLGYPQEIHNYRYVTTIGQKCAKGSFWQSALDTVLAVENNTTIILEDIKKL